MQIDQNIINLCKQNDRKAQFKLYKLCFDFLMRICIRYERNEEDAAEILNQGFLKILLNLDKYKQGTSFPAWCKTVMVNTVINEYWKNKKMKDVMTSVDYQEEPQYDNVKTDYNLFEDDIDIEDVLYYIDQLPPMTKLVFNMYAIDGYKHREIAEKLNMSSGTSKWHLSTARKTLQEKLKKKLKLVI